LTAQANAFCESFIKTLKQEEIYCHQFRDLDQLSAHVEEFIENYYNRKRLHSALGYRTPEEFEREAGLATAAHLSANDAASMEYFQPKSKPGEPTASTAKTDTKDGLS